MQYKTKKSFTLKPTIVAISVLYVLSLGAQYITVSSRGTLSNDSATQKAAHGEMVKPSPEEIKEICSLEDVICNGEYDTPSQIQSLPREQIKQSTTKPKPSYKPLH